jgi:hypothetical protein
MSIESRTNIDGPRLRHSVLIEALALPTTDRVAWAALANAYRALRLIDHWATGARVAEVRDAVTSLNASIPDRASDTIHAGAQAGKHDVAVALFEWCCALSWNSEYRLAAHIAHTALELSAGDHSMEWRAHTECAYAARLGGSLAEAEAHYEACIEIGTRTECPDAVYRGRLGRGRVACARGNLSWTRGRQRRRQSR